MIFIEIEKFFQAMKTLAFKTLSLKLKSLYMPGIYFIAILSNGWIIYKISWYTLLLYAADIKDIFFKKIHFLSLVNIPHKPTLPYQLNNKNSLTYLMPHSWLFVLASFNLLVLLQEFFCFSDSVVIVS